MKAINEPLETYYRQLNKQKSSKALLEVLAAAFEAYGAILPQDSPYGNALTKASAVYSEAGKAQAQLAEQLIGGFLAEINGACASHKDFEKLESKLSNRRLDYDAKLNKVQKSKKEDTKLEEEARVAQEKYVETLEAVTEQMIALNSQDEDQLALFSKLVDDHVKYHEECASKFRNLQSIVSNLEISPIKSRQNIPIISARTSTSSIVKSTERQKSFSAHSKSQEIPRAGSTRSINSQPVILRPESEPEKTQVEALFDFNAENENEMSSTPS